MTAMSDITVLCLPSFMLTSTFVKEPVQVFTPASVSEIKIRKRISFRFLVDPQGKIFMSLDKRPDMKAVLEKDGESTELTCLSRKKICDSFYVWCSDEKHRNFWIYLLNSRIKLLKNEGIPVTAQIISLNH